MKTLIPILLLILSPAWLQGCASSLTGESYSRSETRVPQTVEYGMIEYIRPVQIEGTKTVIGPAAGAAMGGLAGSTVGSDTVSAIAAVAGGVAGGLAGAAAEEAVTRTQGIELTVRLNSGRIIAVVQEVSNIQFHVGDRVRVLTINGTTRVAQ
jgi:outer membrane lipoprotein SlyB